MIVKTIIAIVAIFIYPLLVVFIVIIFTIDTDNLSYFT